MTRPRTSLKSLKRWTRSKNDRPTEITSAALEVFAERGFTATRLDDIATRAGVTKGTLYLYFPSKEAIFKAVVETSLVPNLAQAEALARENPDAAAPLIRAIATRIGRVFDSTRLVGIPKIILAEAGNFPDLARFYFDAVIKRGLALLTALVRRGIERREFRALAPEAAARLIVAPFLLTAL